MGVLLKFKVTKEGSIESFDVDQRNLISRPPSPGHHILIAKARLEKAQELTLAISEATKALQESVNESKRLVQKKPLGLD